MSANRIRPKATKDGRENIKDEVGHKYHPFNIDPSICIPERCITCESLAEVRDYTKGCSVESCSLYGGLSGYLLDESSINHSAPDAGTQWKALRQLREMVQAPTDKDSEDSE